MSENPQETKKEESSFIREYTKSRPLNRRNLLLLILTALLLGVICGGAAAVTYRLATADLRSGGTDDVTADADTASSDAADTASDAAEAAAGTQEDSLADGDTSVQQEIVVQELEVDDYQSLKYDLYAIGRTAGKSIVTVSATSQGTDLFQSDYESTDQNMGLVLSIDEERVLILTQYASVSGAEDLSVILSDDTSVEASLVGSDANIGLAVISADVSDLLSSSLNTIEAATLKTSGVIMQGQIVVAIGAPLGSIYSILDGTITAVTNQITPDDSVYTLYTTSMLGAEDGSGVLINTDGEVIGIMMMEYNSDSDRNTLTAVSMMELYPKIEKLMAGSAIAYLGVSISSVTNALSAEYGLPVGVYVRSVTADSPAYNGGIQAGDIIVKIGASEITSDDDFMEYMLTCSPDETVDVTVMRASGDEYTEVACSVKFSQK